MRFKVLLITIISFLFTANIQAQGVIKGKITDAQSGESLTGANVVYLKGKGVTTDSKGDFMLQNLNAGTYKFEFSFVGYQTVVKTVVLGKNQTKTLDVQLNPLKFLTDEVVITGTRTENQLKNVPNRINVLTPRQLKSIPMQTIDDALEYVSGINVNRPFGIYSSKATVTMRGLSGKEQARTLVMIDGIPVNKTDGGTVNWNLINADNIERVEVAKGPASSLYGGNAMGGVINIITKKPVEPLSGKISLDYGTYNTLGGKIFLAGRPKDSKFFWNMNGFARQGDGYITQAPIDRTPYTRKSNLKEMSVGGKLGYDISKNQNIIASINYYNDYHGTGEKVYQKNGNYTSQETWQANAAYNVKLNEYDVHAGLFYQKENYSKVSDYMSDNRYNYVDVLSKRSDMGLFANASRKFGEMHNVIAGMELKQGAVDASDVYYTSTDKVNNDGTMDFAAVYAQDEILLLKQKMKIVAGLRYDYAGFHDGKFTIEDPSYALKYLYYYQVPDMKDESWTALSPKLSVQYRFNDNYRLYVSYAKGFRPSVLDDMCRSGKISGGFKIANPSLKPEYIDNYEIGGDATLWNKLRLEVSAYYSAGKDFMYYISTGDSVDMPTGKVPVMIRDNISKVEIYGLECNATFTLNTIFNVFANYAYTHPKIKDYKINDPAVDANLDGKYLTDVPDHLVSGGVNFTPGFASFSILAKYTGQMWINDKNGFDNKYLFRYEYPSVFTMDAKVSKTFYNKFGLTLNIQNIFDEKYYDSKSAVCPGRLITGEISYKF